MIYAIFTICNPDDLLTRVIDEFYGPWCLARVHGLVPVTIRLVHVFDFDIRCGYVTNNRRFGNSGELDGIAPWASNMSHNALLSPYLRLF